MVNEVNRLWIGPVTSHATCDLHQLSQLRDGAKEKPSRGLGGLGLLIFERTTHPVTIRTMIQALTRFLRRPIKRSLLDSMRRSASSIESELIYTDTERCLAHSHNR